MNVRKFAVALGLAVIALPALAQSVAGKWNLAMEGFEGTVATFDFAIEGNVLTGTVSSQMDGSKLPLADGKIEGNKITFKSTTETPGGPMTIGYTGVLDGDKIALTLDLGEVAAAAGAPVGEMPPFTLTRAPQ